MLSIPAIPFLLMIENKLRLRCSNKNNIINHLKGGFKMLKMFKTASICLLSLFTLIITLNTGDVSAAPKPKVFLNHTYSTDALYDMEVIRWFYEQLETRTNGKYSAEHYYSEALAKAADQVKAASGGTIDSFFNSLGYNPSEFVLNRVFEHVGITGSFDVQAKAIMDLYENEPLIRQEWDRQNLVLICPTLQTEMVILSKKPLNNIEDLKGVKLRGYAQSGKALQMLGSEIITIAAPERYDALSKGVVDGISGIALDVAYAERLWEAAPYITDIGLGVYSFTYFAMNKKVFNGLPEEDRILIKKLGSEMIDKMVADFPKMHERMISDMVKRGVKVSKFTPAEKERVLKTVTPSVWQAWVDETNKLKLPGQKILDQYRSAVKKYENDDRYITPSETYKRVSGAN
ncbi:TRAP transporter substrate-binding protein DctP [bacterium]|nr:TRAP transporter substrate-binding protein DctP [bacterium]